MFMLIFTLNFYANIQPIDHVHIDVLDSNIMLTFLYNRLTFILIFYIFMLMLTLFIMMFMLTFMLIYKYSYNRLTFILIVYIFMLTFILYVDLLHAQLSSIVEGTVLKEVVHSRHFLHIFLQQKSVVVVVCMQNSDTWSLSFMNSSKSL